MRDFHIRERRVPKPHTTEFSPRDKDVAALLEKGLSNKEIATALHLTEGTVKVYASRLYKKLKLRNDGSGGRIAMRLKAVKKLLGDRPAGNCATCMFRGFARWAQTCAGQLLEKG